MLCSVSAAADLPVPRCPWLSSVGLSCPAGPLLPRYSEERTAVRVVVVEVVVVVVWGLAVVVARAAEVAVHRPRAVARFALWSERAAV